MKARRAARRRVAVGADTGLRRDGFGRAIADPDGREPLTKAPSRPRKGFPPPSRAPGTPRTSHHQKSGAEAERPAPRMLHNHAAADLKSTAAAVAAAVLAASAAAAIRSIPSAGSSEEGHHAVAAAAAAAAALTATQAAELARPWLQLLLRWRLLVQPAGALWQRRAAPLHLARPDRRRLRHHRPSSSMPTSKAARPRGTAALRRLRRLRRLRLLLRLRRLRLLRRQTGLRLLPRWRLLTMAR